VATLPLSWVGKIFYSEDARVETVSIWPVYFERAARRSPKNFDRHVERLAGFLREAPGVNLSMKSVLTVDDIAALKREAVRGAGRRGRRAKAPGGAPAAAAGSSPNTSRVGRSPRASTPS